MSENPVPRPEELNLGEWLQGVGPDQDIAISTRVRFARNVQGFRFSTCMSPEEARELTSYLGKQLGAEKFVEPLRVVELDRIDELERRVLMERHLISREHAGSDRARSVAVNAPESVSIMINEEDHIRAQVFLSGFRVQDAYRKAEGLDEAIMQRVPLAFSEEFGFLTSCPTNTGTGLRVSVMLHLPGLVWAEEIEKATNTAQKIHLAVRGLYGEGSRALGDFYQVSNQVTLGRSEEQIVEDVAAAVGKLMTWERRFREALLEGELQNRTMDRVFRALGTLERARILSSDEALTCLSAVRFGVQQGLVRELNVQTLNRALLLSQPAHLQQIYHEKLGPSERDQRRATLIRRVLGRD